MAKRIKLSDVAQHLGINKSTVSRALNKPERVSEELRIKVQQACEELNYIPNVAAKNLASASSKTIALIVPSFTNSVFADVIGCARKICDSRGYQLLIGDSTYTILGEEKAVEHYLQHNIDGFILTETSHSSKTISLLQRAHIPVIEIMDVIDTPTFDGNFGIDQVEAAGELTRYLINKGRKNIAFCSSWLDKRANLRKLAWEKVMDEHGLSHERMISLRNKTSFQSGAEALEAILSEWPDTDAIFFVNDDLAAGAIMQSHRLGIKVGKDLDIVGFNDLDFASVIHPKLSTVRVPRVEITEMATTALLNLIEDKPTGSLHQRFEHQLIIRESS